ncbi:hypothetical protein AGR4C_Cc100034 [Agrobacterium tumefaciens str. Kerr 14]|uniref:Uncharacterized protein n=1 Tax=Agrobacterium tumefaciens str. Kerr 14 TaxID=1183424 RepID=A0A1S7NKY3_AGRTU|nr:hypothetical protein AGR4C_Cc100034 [Agrobacterium tumefaciens str. Kerr 14]
MPAWTTSCRNNADHLSLLRQGRTCVMCGLAYFHAFYCMDEVYLCFSRDLMFFTII